MEIFGLIGTVLLVVSWIVFVFASARSVQGLAIAMLVLGLQVMIHYDRQLLEDRIETLESALEQ